jgi:hypothetical protein
MICSQQHGIGVKPDPGSFYILPGRIKMVDVAIFFICMFVVTGLIVVMDDGQWNRKK